VEVIRDVSACPRPSQGTAVTIGAYDGVHLGHRAVIREVQRQAAERGCETAVVTFDQHPAMVVRPESAPLLLTDLEQKLELLAESEVDYCVVIHFDEVRSHEPAGEFVTEVLVECLRTRAVVVGSDFHFGYERSGNVALLESMGKDLGFDVTGLTLVPAGPEGDTPVSSTAIRRALLAGDVEAAARMLGRPHEVRGIVVEGDRRGRELGFPTANVSLPHDICLPADGIYAGWYLRPDGTPHPAAISLGRRPTFYETAQASLLEAFLLDTDVDLYGEPARVRFTHRLRGEEKFESVDALLVQMNRDVEDVRRVLAGSAPPAAAV
jgi:riboflavin kinase / FMN adenylyltransferase